MNDRTVYMDYAATSPMEEETIEAVTKTMRDVYGNPSSKHDVGTKASKVLEEARARIAQQINAEPDEIFFTSGGTESDNWAIMGIMSMEHDRHEILISNIEHHAVTNAAKAMKVHGKTVGFVSADFGIVEPDVLVNRISEHTRLVSIMTANNEIGTIQPISMLAKVAHMHGALFHTDAVQAVGHIPVDVKKLDVDMLSASGHKFGAPKGTGFLYIKRGTEIEPFMHGGGHELGLRAGTENVPGAVGMATALDISCENIRSKIEYTMQKREYMIDSLRGIDGVDINAEERCLPGIISVFIEGVYNEVMLRMLNTYGVYVSAGSACNSSSMEQSHVLKAIGLSADKAAHSIRISICRYTSWSEIDYAVNAIREICERMRR